MEHQPYIGKVFHGEYPELPQYHFSEFRTAGMKYGVNLSVLHARFCGIPELPYKPWLTAPEDNSLAGKVVIHRSPRYQTPEFPWGAILRRFGSDVVAVGLPDEHAAFETHMRMKIPLVEATDYLHLASMLQGCALFIGNQSSPMAIAMGLGIPVVQEVSGRQPDCIFAGANAFYGTGAYVKVDGEEIGTTELTNIASWALPPMGWIWNSPDRKTHRGSSLANMLIKLRKQYGDVREDVIRQNVERVKRDHPNYRGNPQSKAGALLRDFPQDVKSRLTNKTTTGNLQDNEDVLHDQLHSSVGGIPHAGATPCDDHNLPDHGLRD
jgi:hypothetical protein